MNKINRYKYQNQLLTNYDINLNRCTQIDFIINGGLFYEQQEYYGISHVYEHLAKYSTIRGKSLVDIFALKGIAYGAKTGYTYINHSFRCQNSQINIVNDCIGAMLEMNLNEISLDHEIIHIKNEIKRDSIGLRGMRNYVLSKLYKQIPICPVSGSMDAITRLKKCDVILKDILINNINFDEHSIYYYSKIDNSSDINTYMKTSFDNKVNKTAFYQSKNNDQHKMYSLLNRKLFTLVCTFKLLDKYEMLNFNIIKFCLSEGFDSPLKKLFIEYPLFEVHFIMTEFATNNSMLVFIRCENKYLLMKARELIMNTEVWLKDSEFITFKIVNHYALMWDEIATTNYYSISLFHNRNERFIHNYENINRCISHIKSNLLFGYYEEEI